MLFSRKKNRRAIGTVAGRRKLISALQFERLENRLLLATVNWIGGSGDWNTVANWSDGATNRLPNAGDDVFLDKAGGPLTITHASGSDTVHSLHANQSNFVLAGGSLAFSAAGVIDLAPGLFQWTGGTLGDGSGVKNAGTIALAGAGTKTLGGTLNNAGTLTHGGTGGLSGGVVNILVGGVYDLQQDLAVSSISNSGTFIKSGGAGTLTIHPFTNTGGTIDVRSGTLAVDGTLFADGSVGATWTGGTFQVSPGAILHWTGSDAFKRYELTGTYTGSGGGVVELADIGHVLTVGSAGAAFDFPSGMFQWREGLIDGGTAGLTNRGTITLAGPSVKPSLRTITNAGTILHAGSGDLAITFGATLTNQVGAIYEIQGNQSVFDTGTFVNRGTLRKSGGTGTSSMKPSTFRNEGGIINVQTGTLELVPNNGTNSTGGTFNVAAGAVLDLTTQSTGVYTGTYTGAGGGTVRLRLLGFFDQGFGLNVAGATFNFPTGMFQWLGGTLDGGAAGFNNTGSITLAGPALKSLRGVLNNVGTIVHAGTGGLIFATANTVLNNLPGSLYDIQGDVNFTGAGGGYTTFNNAGNLRKSAGTGSAGPIGADFVNTGGTIDVQAGSFVMQGFNNPALAHTGGTFRVAGGAVLDLNGGGANSRAVFQGTYSGSGAGVVVLKSGVVAAGDGGAVFNFSPDLFQWTFGTIDGRTAPVTNRGTITLPDIGANIQPFILGELKNAGTIILVGPANLVFKGDVLAAAVFTNLPDGVFEFRGDGLVAPQIGNNNATSFINQGTLRQSGPGTANIMTRAFSNTGTLTVDAGTLRIENLTVSQVSGTTLTAGTWNISAGATLNLVGAPNLTASSASITLAGPGSSFAQINTLASNAGSFRLLDGRSFTTTGAFSNTGALTVGAGSTLDVTGAYTQSAAGALIVQVGGTPASGLFGRLTSTGNATLAGTLNVSLVNGFGPSVGQSFPVMSFAGHSGTFDTVTGITFGAFSLFQVNVNPTSVVLSAQTATPDLAFDSFNTATFPTTGTLGQNVAITYTVRNLSSTPASGDWYDSVYLSRDGALDPGDALLGRVHHVGDVAGLASYTETLTAPLPALADGGYHVLVLADSRGLVPDPNRPNNTGVSVPTIAVTVPTLVLGTPVTGTIANGQDVYYRLVAAPGQDVTFAVDFIVPLEAEFYLRYRDLPDRSDFDQTASPGDLHPRLMLANPQGGSYYVLLHGREGAAGGAAFTLKAEASGFAIVSFDPQRGSIRGQVSVSLVGSRFTPGTVVSLRGAGGTVRTASTVLFGDSSHLTAIFDLTLLPTGGYSVRADDAGQTAVALDTFTVTDGPQGVLSIFIISPGTVRVGSPISVTINLKTSGDTDTIAPLLIVQATNVEAGHETKQALGSGGDTLPGVLPPGYTGKIVLSYPPEPKKAGVTSDFNLSVLNPSATPIDWDSQKESLRPSTIPADAWDAIWPNFRGLVGDTLADFYALLSDDAKALRVTTNSVSELTEFELRKANDLPALPVQAGGVDLAFPAPGLPLAFGRSFGSSIAQRYHLGRLGRGWVDNLDMSASTDASTGLVTIRQGATLRFFAHMPDGSYLGWPGDFATLTQVSGAFRLREASGEVTAFRADGLLDYLQDTNNNRLTAGYSGSQLTSLTHSNGSALTFHYNAQGRIDQVTDPAGRVATYAYDATGEHLLSVTTSAGTTAYTYTPGVNGPGAHAIASISYPDDTHRFFGYDSRGRLARQERDGGAEAVTIAYDLASYRVTDALGHAQTVFFYYSGLTAASQDPLGRNTLMYYDSANNPTKILAPGSAPATSDYDGRGNVTHTTDPQGQTQDFGYEPSFNRLSSWEDALGHKMAFAHDPNGNPLTTTYADGTSDQFSYDAQGNLVRAVNRRGQPIRETYDSNGLLRRKDLADGTHLDYDYDARGNMTSATGPAGATTMAYDLADRMTRITYPGGRFLEYTYDAGSRRIRTIDQSGFTINYRYDAVGRLAELTDGQGQRIVSYDYDAAGRRTRESRGNGTFTTHEYDSAGELLHLVHHAVDATVLSRFDYTYDALGLRRSMTTLEGKTTYDYDAVGRLTSVILPAGRTISYAYDAAGNRTVVTDNGVPTTYTTNALNQYVTVGGAGLTYDADGNLTAAGGPKGYRYDDEGRLLSVITPQGTWSYEYDALGNRIASTYNGIRTEYLIDPAGMGNVVGEYDGAGNLQAHYVHGLGLASRVDATNQSDYYQFDAVGNTAQLTGPDGTVLNSYSYLPFGESLGASESVANPFTFVGQLGVLREGNGLDFMRKRWYDPAQGRFTQADPIGLAGGTNFYSYAVNNPVSFNDPSGLMSPLAVSVAIAVLSPPGVSGFAGTAIDYAFPGAAIEADVAAQTAYNALHPPASTASAAPAGPPAIYTNPYQLPIGSQGGFTQAQANAALERALANQAANAWRARAIADLSKIGRGGLWGLGLAGLTAGSAVLIYEAGYFGHFLGGGDTPNCVSYIPLSIQPLCKFPQLTTGILGPRTSTLQIDDNPRLSVDPNDIVGPAGFGPDRFVPPVPLPYTIHFENKPDAGGPAAEVFVTEQLDPDLDLDTFQLGDFGFGGLTVAVPAGRQFYHTRVDVRSTLGVFVDFTAELDRLTRTVTWTFTALDPATLDVPIDIFVGFLPPDKNAPEGQGFVTYSVGPRADSQSGTRIDAQASIVFDQNAPILTPLFVNTIDAGPPTSSVSALATTSPLSFNVNWSGSDDAGGSGIGTYDVFVSLDGGSFASWLTSTTQTSAIYTGLNGHRYAFYSVAVDNVGHREAAPSSADASTTVITNSPPTLASVSLTPTTAFETSTLTATPVGGADADGDAITYSYQWFVNGSAIAPTTSTLTGTYFNKANTVSVRVTPNDGTVDGAQVGSNSVTISNSPPSIVSVSLTPTIAFATSTLTAAVVGGADADGDTITYRYKWFVNGSAIAPTTSTLGSPFFSAGNTVSVRVTPNDGTTNGTPVSSNSVVISAAVAVDVTSLLTFRYYGAQYNSRTKTYAFYGTITNKSNQSIRGPVQLGWSQISPVTAQAVGANGAWSNGAPYFDLSGFLGSDGILQPGETSQPRTFAIKVVAPGAYSFTTTVTGVLSSGLNRANYLSTGPNLKDTVAPESHVASMPEKNGSSDILVAWGGADEAYGSGVASFDIYVAQDSGAYVLWIKGSQELSAKYAGKNGHSYAFYSLAHDLVGNSELLPPESDMETAILYWPKHNQLNGLDVSDDGSISPLDALLIINNLNTQGARSVLTEVVAPPYFDTSADNAISPLDVLLVINRLNRYRRSGEGESTDSNELSVRAYPMSGTPVDRSYESMDEEWPDSHYDGQCFELDRPAGKRPEALAQDSALVFFPINPSAGRTKRSSQPRNSDLAVYELSEGELDSVLNEFVVPKP